MMNVSGKNMSTNDKQFRDLQEQVIDYFKDHSDVTLRNFIDSFVYHIPNNGSGKMIEKFMEDNGLTTAYVNYLSMINSKETNKFFHRASMSEVSMIENIKHALMNAAYNRFTKMVVANTKEDAKEAKYEKKYKRVMKSVDKLMDAGSTDRYHDALDELKEMYLEN